MRGVKVSSSTGLKATAMTLSPMISQVSSRPGAFSSSTLTSRIKGSASTVLHGSLNFIRTQRAPGASTIEIRERTGLSMTVSTTFQVPSSPSVESAETSRS